jgi:hypothetical protein
MFFFYKYTLSELDAALTWTGTARLYRESEIAGASLKFLGGINQVRNNTKVT